MSGPDACCHLVAKRSQKPSAFSEGDSSGGEAASGLGRERGWEHQCGDPSHWVPQWPELGPLSSPVSPLYAGSPRAQPHGYRKGMQVMGWRDAKGWIWALGYPRQAGTYWSAHGSELSSWCSSSRVKRDESVRQPRAPTPCTCGGGSARLTGDPQVPAGPPSPHLPQLCLTFLASWDTGLGPSSVNTGVSSVSINSGGSPCNEAPPVRAGVQAGGGQGGGSPCFEGTKAWW